VTRETVTRSTLLRDMFRQIDSTQRSDIYYVSRYNRPFEYPRGLVTASIADGYTWRSDFELAHACEFPFSLMHTDAFSIRVIALHIVS